MTSVKITPPATTTTSGVATINVNAAPYSAAGDARQSRTVTMTNGSPIITDTTSARWVSGDVGKKIAGAGIPVGTTILSRQSASQVTLSANCTQTVNLRSDSIGVTGVRVLWYTQDDTAAITAAITAMSGRGQLVFPGEGYVAEGLTLKSKHHWYGTGEGSTTLYLKPGSSLDLVVSENFATLTGTNALGVYDCGINEMTLNGGSDPRYTSYNSSGGWCLKTYGYNLRFHNLEIAFGKAGGWLSEHNSGTDGPTGREQGGPEAYVTNLSVHENQGKGVYWRGPHDSIAANWKIYDNTGEGLHATQGATWNGGGLCLNGYAVWGNGTSGTYNLRIEADAHQWANGHTEMGLGCTASVLLQGSQIRFHGNNYPGGTPTTEVGIVLGTGPTSQFYSSVLDIDMHGWPAGVGLDMTYSGGGNVITGVINATSGTPYTKGAKFDLDTIILDVVGGGGPALYNFIQNGESHWRGFGKFQRFLGATTGTVMSSFETDDTAWSALQIYNGSANAGASENWQLRVGGSTGDATIGAAGFGLFGLTLNDYALVAKTSGRVIGKYGFGVGASGLEIRTGTGAPALALPVGSLYLRSDGGTSTTLYVKETGGSTSSGWVAK